MTPVAVIKTPFPDKFSVPRQPGLAPSVQSIVELQGDYDHQASIQGLEQHSHLWLLFQFDRHKHNEWKAQVRPPRLGGNQTIGVFATRSPYRPNGIGLSVVKLEGIKQLANGTVQLVVSGADLVDQTPIVDIKPYIPYVDCITEAQSQLANEQPTTLMVSFSDRAKQQLAEVEAPVTNLAQVIEEVLAQDPRPAYHRDKQQDRQYASRLYQLDLLWRVHGSELIVEEIRQLSP